MGLVTCNTMYGLDALGESASTQVKQTLTPRLMAIEHRRYPTLFVLGAMQLGGQLATGYIGRMNTHLVVSLKSTAGI